MYCVGRPEKETNGGKVILIFNASEIRTERRTAALSCWSYKTADQAKCSTSASVRYVDISSLHNGISTKKKVVQTFVHLDSDILSLVTTQVLFFQDGKL